MAVIFFVKFVASFSSWLCVTDYPILASLVPNATMQSMPPLVCKTENLAERIRFQQQEVDLLKKEIFGTDKIPRSAYIRRFLREFADDTPWVHLDIAGTAWENERKPHLAKGPTGVAIRTLINYICNHAAK